jgi:hypothetical protein
MTYGDQFNSALKCETPEQAAAWMAVEIERYEKESGIGRIMARKIILSNLGYMAGYCDKATALKIQTLFGAQHPILGDANEYWSADPKDVFRAGEDHVDALDIVLKERGVPKVNVNLEHRFITRDAPTISKTVN